MGRRADITVSNCITAQWSGAGTNYIVQTPSGVLYIVCIDIASDVSYRKSTDGGVTWSAATPVFTGTVANLSVWYDRWSNISAGLIHCAYTESGSNDTLYRTINTESSDALSTQTTIFAGSTAAGGGHLSISRAVGGNVYCKTVIDAGAEGGFFRLSNANVPNGAWDAARTVDEAIATLDQMILLPDFDAADTQDMLAIFQDASVTETSRKLYDDSGNSWAEASINASVIELNTATAFPNLSVAMDIENTRHVLVVWSATDAANQDLLCYTIDSGAITAKTDVVTNATDDCGLAAISIDLQTGWWYVFYGGKSDGSETWNTAMHVYYKVSKDQGSTWGAETLVDTGATFQLQSLFSCPRLYRGPHLVAYFRNAQTDDIVVNVDHTLPRAVSLIGV